MTKNIEAIIGGVKCILEPWNCGKLTEQYQHWEKRPPRPIIDDVLLERGFVTVRTSTYDEAVHVFKSLLGLLSGNWEVEGETSLTFHKSTPVIIANPTAPPILTKRDGIWFYFNPPCDIPTIYRNIHEHLTAEGDTEYPVVLFFPHFFMFLEPFLYRGFWGLDVLEQITVGNIYYYYASIFMKWEEGDRLCSTSDLTQVLAEQA